jgi:hypothetical protein
MTSLLLCNKNQAASASEWKTGNVTSLRCSEAAIICLPRSVTLHLRVRDISDEFVGVKAIQYPPDFCSHCFAMLIDPEGIETGNWGTRSREVPSWEMSPRRRHAIARISPKAYGPHASLRVPEISTPDYCLPKRMRVPLAGHWQRPGKAEANWT